MAHSPLSADETAAPFVEKRSYARHSAFGHVICRTQAGGIETVVHCKPVNLSRNGVLLDLPAELVSGMEVDLEFLSGSGRSAFTVRGRIRSVAPKELGRWQAGCAFHDPIPATSVASFTS